MQVRVSAEVHSHLYDIQMQARAKAYSLRDAVRVAPDNYGGYGVFAVKDLPANTIYIPYVGERLTYRAHESRYSTSGSDPEYTLQLGDVYIDAVNMPRVACAHMLNHSARSNCIFEDDYATNVVDIRAGSELTTNYGHDYFKGCHRPFDYETRTDA